ncbi:MAG: hypothetical protein KAR20_15085 [Candidatus Heimdallarchaeota archaeon]|nr:hypothetical protein [Candidatus Heimdallarchaeota archaeon]
MKKNIALLLTLLVCVFLAASVQAQYLLDDEDEEFAGKPVDFVDGAFGVYYDRGNRQNHFIPSGWMGDFDDLKMNDRSSENPHSGKTCMKFTYSAEGKQGANWCGVFWQTPANNWGEKKGGFDLREATKLTFWARGEIGGERIQEFKFGGIGGTYPDSDSWGIGPIDLTAEWTKYEIDLTDVDLSYINGGYCWSTNADANPDGAVIYLDDIQYEI